MSYIDGFVIAVPSGNRDKFVRHASTADAIFRELGATRIVECWEDDVPDGKRTDFRRSVAATADEKVAFSWIEWPDKASRDAAMAKTTELMRTDPRMDPATNPMPFDGARMIYGGFAPLLDRGTRGSYVDGFVAPVPDGGRDAYRAHAERAAAAFEGFGAVRVVECWGDDVPAGKVTDFARAVAREAGETVVFSWIEWPDKATRDAGWARMMAEDPMKDEPMPFDGQRMIYGGFVPVVDL